MLCKFETKSGDCSNPRCIYKDNLCPVEEHPNVCKFFEAVPIKPATITTLGENLRWYRTERGLSQLALAVEVDAEQSSIRSYELGKTQPKSTTLIKLADFFNISLDELCGRQRSDKNENTKTKI